jgi:hypothetical protein
MNPNPHPSSIKPAGDSKLGPELPSLISTNSKVGVCCMSYLGLTTIVEPLNVVWMGVSTCHQGNLCHKISTHQIVAASSIDDGVNVAIFDDEENLE